MIDRLTKEERMRIRTAVHDEYVTLTKYCETEEDTYGYAKQQKKDYENLLCKLGEIEFELNKFCIPTWFWGFCTGVIIGLLYVLLLKVIR